MKNNKTYVPKLDEIQQKCYVVDAKDKILGRVAAKVAHVLRGKHKAMFTPHLDTGDTVIVINAEKIRVTGKKMTDKIYKRYSGYRSGLKKVALGDMLQIAPTQAMQLAISRMIPDGKLGDQIRRRVRVYAGDQHPHQAQKPIPLDV
ncbi:MAG: 50S ribosomal protein L13 [Candidatus Omnitrophota bacterium]|nr:50S ribosomal protein L13 [Candidatus Omnitrophota bacterium]MDZ4241518.1 50S ribosomal protein L13 [Candidatus Omnitrophota bacterium]